MSYVVSKDIPPPMSYPGVWYYERSGDPFHVSAFEGTPNNQTMLLVGGGKINNAPTQRRGWMAIDYCENPVGFFEDGYVAECDIPEYELREGYFEDKRMFAYPPNSEEMIARHNQYKEQRSGN